MAASSSDKFKKLARRWVGQIGAGGVSDASTTTIPLASATNLPTDTGVVAVIDRVDANGTATPSLEETVVGVVSGSNLVGSTRGAEGTAQAHAAGAVVEILFTNKTWGDLIDGILVDHNQSGYHKNVTLAAAGAVLDANGNELIKFTQTASAVNEFTVGNSLTGSEVTLSATGGDTNIGIKLASKGTGEINLSSGYYQGFQSYSPSAAATATLDLSLGNDHRITMPAGNITIAISNAKVGQKFLVSTTQDSGGSRTVTWFTTIKWAGESAPTLTTTGNKRDTFGFVVTGSGTYDGFVVGQNI